MDMIEIKTREEANKYYKLVNGLVDNFISETKARPIEVYKYLKRKSLNFLEKHNLLNIKGIDRILSDILEHRKSLEMDKIITFENFNFLIESLDDLKSNNTLKEKILADFFHISTGHIESLDQDLNLYKIKDFDETLSVIILSDKDVETLTDNLKKLLIQRFFSRDLDMDTFSTQFVKMLPNIKFSEFVDQSAIDNILSQSIDIESCLEYFKFYFNKKADSEFKIKQLIPLGESHGYKIWKIVY